MSLFPINYNYYDQNKLTSFFFQYPTFLHQSPIHAISIYQPSSHELYCSYIILLLKTLFVQQPIAIQIQNEPDHFLANPSSLPSNNPWKEYPLLNNRHSMKRPPRFPVSPFRKSRYISENHPFHIELIMFGRSFAGVRSVGVRMGIGLRV